MQTATDRFYPDFVAELEEGRYLVVEYKGADRRDSGDAVEKEAMGKECVTESAGNSIFKV